MNLRRVVCVVAAALPLAMTTGCKPTRPATERPGVAAPTTTASETDVEKAKALVARLGGRIQERPGGQEANLDGTEVTDADLPALLPLGGLGGLCLSLRKTAITDDGLRCLADFDRLIYIDLSETKVTHRGLKHLINCPQLEARDICVTGTSIRSSYIKYFAVVRYLGVAYPFGEDGAAQGWKVPDPLVAGPWASSEDKKLSMRLIVKKGIHWVVAELRNDSTATMKVLRPFAKVGSDTTFQIQGPRGEVPFSNEKYVWPDMGLWNDPVVELAPGEVFPDGAGLGFYPGLNEPGEYAVAYRYVAHEDPRLGVWTGAIQSKPVKITQSHKPATRPSGG